MNPFWACSRFLTSIYSNKITISSFDYRKLTQFRFKNRLTVYKISHSTKYYIFQMLKQMAFYKWLFGSNLKSRKQNKLTTIIVFCHGGFWLRIHTDKNTTISTTTNSLFFTLWRNQIQICISTYMYILQTYSAVNLDSRGLAA